MKKLLSAVAVCVAASTAAIATVQSALAETFPSRAVTIVVPYSAGGVTDSYARMLQPVLQERWGQTVIVENKPGSGSLLGAMDVAQSDPDGHRILMTAYGVISNDVLLPNSPFDLADLEPVHLMGRGANMLIMPKDHRFNTIQEVTEWAKENPGQLKLASSGVGASPHIAAALWASKVGVDFLHIPYKGSAPSRLDVIAGRVDGMFDGVSSVSYIEAGQIKGIALAAEKRHPSLPDVPTFREAGIDLVFGTIFGFYVPKGTSEGTMDELHEAMGAALATPEIHDLMVKQGLDTEPMSRQEFKQLVQNELDSLRKLVAEGRLTPQ